MQIAKKKTCVLLQIDDTCHNDLVCSVITNMSWMGHSMLDYYFYIYSKNGIDSTQLQSIYSTIDDKIKDCKHTIKVNPECLTPQQWFMKYYYKNEPCTYHMEYIKESDHISPYENTTCFIGINVENIKGLDTKELTEFLRNISIASFDNISKDTYHFYLCPPKQDETTTTSVSDDIKYKTIPFVFNYIMIFLYYYSQMYIYIVAGWWFPFYYLTLYWIGERNYHEAKFLYDGKPHYCIHEKSTPKKLTVLKIVSWLVHPIFTTIFPLINLIFNQWVKGTITSNFKINKIKRKDNIHFKRLNIVLCCLLIYFQFNTIKVLKSPYVKQHRRSLLVLMAFTLHTIAFFSAYIIMNRVKKGTRFFRIMKIIILGLITCFFGYLIIPYMLPVFFVYYYVIRLLFKKNKYIEHFNLYTLLK